MTVIRFRAAPPLLTAIAMLACCTLPLAGCSQGPGGAPQETARATPTARGPATPAPAADPRVTPHLDRFQRVEAMITRWDALRADGRSMEAQALEPKIRAEVDGDFATFERGARGELGPHAQYLSTSALGFSASPAATRLLIERVAERDARLAGNALIALGVRADPQTPVEILLARIGQNQPLGPKRYAPLALANVLQARAAAALPVERAVEQQALARLGTVVVDHDPIVRLHVAKALGAIRVPGTYEYLQVLTGDPQMRVRWGAAAALERHGDPRGFPDVIRLLAEVAPESRHIIRDVLVSYAGRLQGRPLTAAEIESLGTGPRAWSGWFNHYKKTRPSK